MPSAGRRSEPALNYALGLVLHSHNPMSLREAVAATLQEKRINVSVATLGRRVKACRDGNEAQRNPGRPPALSLDQEVEVAEMCRYFSHRGAPVVLDEIADIVKDAYGHLPAVSARLPGGRPGRDWMKSFCRRHGLSFSSPSRQAAERYHRRIFGRSGQARRVHPRHRLAPAAGHLAFCVRLSESTIGRSQISASTRFAGVHQATSEQFVVCTASDSCIGRAKQHCTMSYLNRQKFK